MREPYDTADEQNRAEEEQAKARLKRQRETEDIRWLMAHAQGRRIAARVLERAGVRRTSFHNSGSTMAFNEGRRDMGLWLEGELLELTPDAWLKMMKEFRDE